MAAGDLGSSSRCYDGDGGGISSTCIVEAVRTMLSEAEAVSLSAAQIERFLRTIPKRLLSCTKEKKSEEQGEDDNLRYRWRLSHESVRRWLTATSQSGGHTAPLRISIRRGHQMLAARLAHRLAAVPIRRSLAQWMGAEEACIDPVEIVLLAVHICAGDAGPVAKPADTSFKSRQCSVGGNNDFTTDCLSVLQTLGANVLTTKQEGTSQTALHICAVFSKDEVRTHNMIHCCSRICIVEIPRCDEW